MAPMSSSARSTDSVVKVFFLLLLLLYTEAAMSNQEDGIGYAGISGDLEWSSWKVGSSLRAWLDSCEPQWMKEKKKGMKGKKGVPSLSEIAELARKSASPPSNCPHKARRQEGEDPDGATLSSVRFLDRTGPETDGEARRPDRRFELDYFGGTDPEGRFHGKAMLLIRTHDRGIYGFHALDASSGMSAEEMRVTFEHGLPLGRAWIRCRDGSVIQAHFDHRGSLDGPMVILAPRAPNNDDDDDNEEEDEDNEEFFYLKLVCGFRSGRFSGPAWLVRHPERRTVLYFEEETLTRGAFLYPDLETSLVGLFRHGLLQRGAAAKAAAEGCDHRTGVRRIRFSATEENTDAAYRYDPPSHYRFGDDPTLEDPYERKNVEVLPVEIDPASGLLLRRREKRARRTGGADELLGRDGDGGEGEEEGLFAKRRIPKGAVIAFYSGLVVPCELDFWALREGPEPTAEENDRRNSYLLSLVKKDKVDLCVDIPPEFGRDLSRFRSTLGHKCNHSFEPNSEFREFASHPRFGRVMSVVARRDVAAGEEVTCDYNYGKGDGEGPRWYRKAREEWNKRKKMRRKEEEQEERTTAGGREPKEEEEVVGTARPKTEL